VDIASLSRPVDWRDEESSDIPVDPFPEDELDSKPSDVEMSVMELWDDVAGLAISMWAVCPLLSMNFHFPRSRTRPTPHWIKFRSTKCDPPVMEYSQRPFSVWVALHVLTWARSTVSASG